MLENFVSPYDAHVVEQLDAAGAVMLGKTQHGRVRDGLVQRELAFRPGAQSVGPARAVPGGILGRLGRRGGGAAGAGGDRHRHRRLDPAAGGVHRRVRACKPTYGLVSRYGMIAFASSLDQAGPIAQQRGGPRAAAERDGRLRRARLDQPRAPEGGLHAGARRSALRGLRIGLPKEYFGEGVEPEACAARSRPRSRWYTSQGAIASTSSCRTRSSRVPVYYVIAPAEASSQPLALRRRALRPPRRRSTTTWSTCTAARAPKASARR